MRHLSQHRQVQRLGQVRTDVIQHAVDAALVVGGESERARVHERLRGHAKS